MGFDIYLSSFRNGRTSRFPRKVAEAIFDRGALAPSRLEHVKYPGGRGEIYCDDGEGAMISGFMVAHFGGRTISERLLEIAAVTQSLLMWPSTFIMFGVTDLAHIAHLPDEIRDAHVALVRNVDELWSAINAEAEAPRAERARWSTPG